MLKQISLGVVFLVFGVGLLKGQNLYPDPDFEANGVVGDAHSGKKAGHLRVDEKGSGKVDQNLFKYVEVEPFATYRISGWVKARSGKGNGYALQIYEVDSFDGWANIHRVPLGGASEWTKVETVIVAFGSRLYVRPLYFEGAAGWEAWVDDICLEKIKPVEETMRLFQGKTDLASDEIQLLARYWIAKRDFAKAEGLAGGASAPAKADIACLLAKNHPDCARRLFWFGEMIRAGGLTKTGGSKRFDEIFSAFAVEEKVFMIAWCEDALMSVPGAKNLWNVYRRFLEQYASSQQPLTCIEMESEIKKADSFFERIAAKLPADAVLVAEVDGAKRSLKSVRERFARQKESQGCCRIKLGGKALSPDSHAIVMPDDAALTERYAARDLRYHLELLSGQCLPILKDSDAMGDKRAFLVVGKSRLLEDWKVKVDWNRLGKEGICIKTSGPHLILAGGQRGALYACSTLLEDYLGVRWLSADCTVFPKRGTFDLKGIDKTYVPPLEYREPSSIAGRDGNWAAHNKVNGYRVKVSEKQGGRIDYRGFVHTFKVLVPPEKYFKGHPEYYAENEGQRHHEKAQLCLTNPEVENIVVEEVKRWLRETPDASIVSVSQNDGSLAGCQCAKCKAIDDEEGSPSGSLLRFVNRVAERVEGEHPHVAIDTLAYRYSRFPPKITKPRANVIVRLCSIECSFDRPLEANKQDRAFCEDIVGWSRICRRLYVWDYVTNFRHYLLPHPNLRVLKPNIQFFIKNGVKGIFEQGNGRSPGGELAELRTWLLAKLLWNPDADFNELLQTFLDGYYGAAAPYLRQYVDLLHDSLEKREVFMDCYTTIPALLSFFVPEAVVRAEGLFDRAEEAVANDPVLLKRVQTVRLPLLFLRLECGTHREEKGYLFANVDSAVVEKFEKVARAAGVTHTRETPKPDIDSWIRGKRAGGARTAIKRLRNAVLSLDVLPGFGGRIWRMKYLPTGREVFRPVGEPDKWKIGENGYEEYCGAEYRSPGWCEKYEVKELSEQRLVLETFLPKQGIRLIRRIELDAHKPVLRIVTTLVNQTQTACQAGLRIHPAFAMDDPRRAMVKIRRKDGGWREQPLAALKDQDGIMDVWFRGNDLPFGEWSFVDGASGLEVINRFDPAKVSQCYLFSSSFLKQANLELFSTPSCLRPGESWEFSQTYELIPFGGGI
ncbi:MAG: DUF4838 domain-containing protein [Verrucomicrobiae bacterium]|nr:DUF4838 domain-containing protein [Verrucomicrobiae bacterium]